MALAQPKPSSEFKVRSINEALEVLDTAVESSSEDIREMIKKDISHLKSTLGTFSEQSQSRLKALADLSAESFSRIKSRATETSKEAIKKIDGSAHQNPWAYVAGAAVGSLFLGYMMAKRNHRT